MSLKAYMNERRRVLEGALERYLPPEDMPPRRLHQAMRYSVFAGGKRIRPILCLAASEAYDPIEDAALRAACALEIIHTYSLIHDDLPAMDNDDLRRGKPTNHVVYGEATAILAGDGLLNLAFEVLAFRDAGELSGRVLLRVIAEIGKASGSQGMVGGQCADMEAEEKEPTQEMVHFIHTHKTARLIAASLAAGALCGGAGDDSVDRIRDIGLELGLAFQITDDILDIEGTKESLGKSAGKDAEEQKATYPALVGLEESKRAREELLGGVEKGLDSLLGPKASRLKELARLMIIRQA
jgi:geranylgeranyl diphosphate synthase type II